MKFKIKMRKIISNRVDYLSRDRCVVFFRIFVRTYTTVDLEFVLTTRDFFTYLTAVMASNYCSTLTFTVANVSRYNNISVY